MKTDFEEVKDSLNRVELHPSLEEIVNNRGLDRTKLSVGLKTQGDDTRLDVSAREEVIIYDGTKGAAWNVPSLRALFRGDRAAPPMGDRPPPAYMPLFMFIEMHVLTFCNALGPKTDGEFEEAYSNMRRRPDGRSFSDLHFVIWQAAAGLAGTRIISAAEFDAIFERLTRSARTFRTGVVSRNYAAVLQQMNPE
jgi:hypothetical protein